MSSGTVVVTGGAGFIGSHTCKALASEGFLPVAVDNLSRGNEGAVRWGPLEKADIRDATGIEDIIRRHNAVAVIHFAAFAYVGESVTDPAAYYSNNVVGTLSLLDACVAAGMKNLIFSSSCATYGVPEQLPITEDSRQQPINPYGRTKLICEHAIRDYASAYGLRFALLRYFNACGADPEGEIGEWHDPETHLVPRALQAAAGTIEKLDVFGDDYETPDGTCIRDYIHVCDLAAGHVAALTRLLRTGGNLAVNLGTGRGASIREILSAIEAECGKAVPVSFGARREGDPPALVADVRRARETLEFAPRHSDLASIVRTAAPFFGLGQANERRV